MSDFGPQFDAAFDRTLSAQACGCDPGAGWTCQMHRDVNDMHGDVDLRPKGSCYCPAKQGEDCPLTIAECMARTPEMEVTYTSAPPRKHYPVATGLLDYFPDALREVAHVSFIGNEQHNPGQPVHWDRAKSTDEADALMRHLLERGTMDTDGLRHTAKVAWRALALLQKEIEQEGK